MIGTILNIITVLIGGTTGALLGNRLPARVRETVMHGLGLATLTIGIQLSLSQLAAAETTLGRLTIVVVLASILTGGILGELLDLESRLEAMGHWLEQRTSGRTADSVDASSTFSRGFVTASLVFCVGPMAIIGALRDGMSGDYTLLAIKSTLDGFAALAFASSLGVGVIFSALSVFVYQGTLSLGSHWISAILSDVAIAEMSASGGILMLGIGLALLDIKRVRVANLLPSVFVAPVLTSLALPLVKLVG